MLTMKSAMRGTAIKSRMHTSKQPRAPLRVCAYTEWLLQPDAASSGQKTYSLSAIISEQATKALDTGSTQDKAFEDMAGFNDMCDHIGVNVTFESSLDAPSSLTITDEGSSADIKVDGEKVEKNVAVQLGAGSKLELGDEAFKVIRDVNAHA